MEVLAGEADPDETEKITSLDDEESSTGIQMSVEMEKNVNIMKEELNEAFPVYSISNYVETQMKSEDDPPKLRTVFTHNIEEFQDEAETEVEILSISSVHDNRTKYEEDPLETGPFDDKSEDETLGSVDATRRPKECNICKKFVSKYCDREGHCHVHSGHDTEHLEVHQHFCDVCNKAFMCIAKLKEHQRIHRAKRVHACDVCTKSFPKLSALNQHKRTHTGERPFQCDVCQQTFTQSCSLKAHKLLHTGERPHSCPTCNKTFTQLSKLKEHQRIHTGERPYACNVCGKSFIYLSNMKKHQRTHVTTVKIPVMILERDAQ